MTAPTTPDEDSPLWTAETLRPLLLHPDERVRGWALDRLTRFYPGVLPEVLPAALLDRSSKVVLSALDGCRVNPPEGARELARERLKERGLPAGPRLWLSELAQEGKLGPKPADEHEERVVELASDPERLRGLAPGALRGGDDTRWLDVMVALGYRPERWVGSLVLELLDELLLRDTTYSPWEVLCEVGEIRALERALSEHRPGEKVLAEHISFLASLAGKERELPALIVEEARERAALHERIQKAMGAANPLRALRDTAGPLSLMLRCQRCRKVGEYDVESATLDPGTLSGQQGWDGVVLGRVVVCKWCGAVDEYELTRGARLAVHTQGLPNIEVIQRGGEQSGPVYIQKLGMWDGTQIRRPSQALAHLQALAERKPESGEAWRRLGNLRHMYGQGDGAVAAWKEALERDPTEAEACYALACYHDTLKQPEETFRYAQELIARQSRQRGAWPRRVEMVIGGLLLALQHAGARPVGLRVAPAGAPAEQARTIDLRALPDVNAVEALFHGGQVPQTELTDQVQRGELGPLRGVRARSSFALPARSGAKVGRNDPCTCGSGKKFKKCCGA